MAVAIDFAAAERVRRVLHDSTYKDYVENAASFNTKLLTERKMRLPFLDSQTGLAQTSCRLWFHRRQRMPGLKEGQVYSYPQQRWRKRRRQYLQQRNIGENANAAEMGGWMNEDSNISVSKDSAASKDELSKDSWYYDDIEGDGLDFEEPDFSDDDYEDVYIKRKKKKLRPSKGSRRKKPNEDSSAKQTRRQQAMAQHQIEERIKREQKRQSGRRNEVEDVMPVPPPPPPPPHLPPQQPMIPFQAPPPPMQQPPPQQPPPSASPPPPTTTTGLVFTTAAGPAKEPVQPSPYCDFCLGDDQENKKTGSAEVLVSCADCGRSGHPTCLQFTDNMMVSAKCYGWQCIECKCCWLCGTSENDEQLLFCDDCDRGYHMYCLQPPLTSPPEGSWSCKLCIKRFHSSQ